MAKTVTIKVTHDFRDRTEDLQLRKRLELLEVPPERAQKLINLGLAVRAPDKEPVETENVISEAAK